jgi:uncharacterized protein (DUF488 family)
MFSSNLGHTGAMTHASAPQVVSIGYEGRSASELVEELRAQRVAVLVDIRLTPISRKPGLSKTALAAAVRAAGIEYVHLRELGNPKSNRPGYRARQSEALDLYGAILSSAGGQSALRHVTELLDGGAVALLCFERDHADCHRHQVVDELGARCEDLQVTYA